MAASARSNGDPRGAARPKRAAAFRWGIVAAALALGASVVARAEGVPSLWDPGLRLEKPELGALKAIRFLTSDDYPPLDFANPDGSLTGFNVDIARAICEELRLPCTIQARRWDTLVDALAGGKGDAMIASLRATPGLRRRLDFTSPYYLTPARFAARRDAPEGEVGALAGKTVGVVERSAHARFLALFFPEAKSKLYPDFASLRRGLQAGEADLVFADGLSLAVWLGGEEARECCAFRGGPYLESRFFGEGVSIALRPDDVALRRALDYALARLWASGRYAELYRKYFPLSFY